MAQHAAQTVGNRQPQPQAFFGARLMAVQAFELFENDLQFVVRDARPAIPHFKAQFTATSAYAQQHRPLGVAQGIGQEVLQNAPQ